MDIDAVLRELDGYRGAIRQAFDEGYAAARASMPLEAAWQQSEARTSEWSFAYTRMSVGAVVATQQRTLEVSASVSASLQERQSELVMSLKSILAADTWPQRQMVKTLAADALRRAECP